MNKGTLKRLGLGLIGLGIAFAIPPVFPPYVDDLFLNVPVSNWIALQFSLPPLYALVASYTVVPLALVAAGVWVYPAKNGWVLKHVVGRVRKAISWQFEMLKREPVLGLVYLVVGWFLFNFYIGMIEGAGLV